jgi:hypothetical protein
MERRVRVDGVGGGPPQALDQAGVRPDQELDGLEAAVLGGQVEGGLAPAVPDAGVAGVLQQEADDGGVSVLCGAVQRRFVVFGRQVHIANRWSAQQQPDDIDVSRPGGQVQRRRPLHVDDVGRGVVLQQELDDLPANNE